MKTTAFSSTIHPRHEAGQVMLFTILALGIFLLGAMAFAIDLSNMWFNRQSAQTAADAACTAAAMDMLVSATNGSMPANAHFTASSANTYDCNTANPTPSPCSYAALNGYSSTITRNVANSGTLGNNVYIDFPSASSVNLSGLDLPPAAVAASALVRVRILNNISTWFAGMLGSTKQGTGASAICGVIQATSPIPILVMNPTVPQALNIYGTPNISIVGGPSKSIQVNSGSTSATRVQGSATVNLCAGGGTYCGSAMGVWGSQGVPGGFYSSVSTCSTNRPAGAPACTATQVAPQWNSPAAPVADPLASSTAPSQPTNVPGAPTAVFPPTAGCPDSSGCYEYAPGYYPSGICVGKGGCTYKTYTTAIFDPGIYYILGGLTGASNSCLRPSTAVGDGSGGTLFYFADTNSVGVVANSGCGSQTPFSTTSGSGSLLNGVKCTSTSQIPSNLPGSFDGSVLLGPCQKPTVTALCAPNCNLNFGDPLGTSDPNGEQRGVMFFQNRSKNASTNPSWSGGGKMLLAGTMYFHQCVTSGTDTGYGCASGAFNDQLDLGGNSGASTYVLGDIIADQLTMHGTPGIIMDLNPSAAYTQLKASLLQ
jgi:Flp pilus assembly protein TadG